MKKNYSIFFCIFLSLVNESIYPEDGSPQIYIPIPNWVSSPSSQESDYQFNQEMPIEMTFSEIMSVNADDIDTFDIAKKKATNSFIRKEMVTDPDSAGTVGYFWNVKNTEDRLQYGGIARIEQDRYLNVVKIDASTVSDQDQTVPLNTETLAVMATNGKFDDGYLVYIGTISGTNDGKGNFVQSGDGKIYYLYGRYLNTLTPIDNKTTSGHDREYGIGQGDEASIA